MSRINLAVLLVLGLLLVTAKQSMQMSLRNPTAEIETNNGKLAMLRVGLVFTSDHNEKAVIDSGLFEPDSENPHVDISGRRFHVGTLNNTPEITPEKKNTPIVYVKTGTHSVNVATAVQTLVLKFNISIIIFFGNAGSLDKNVADQGDVVVPGAFAFTGVWEWEEFRAQNKGKLVFGNYNYPKKGKNLLGTVAYENITLYSPSEDPKEVFWIPIYCQSATEELIKDLKLKECHSGICLPRSFKVVQEWKASTSDFYVRNQAYGDFLLEKFNVTTADSASAAVALTALSNEKPFLVYQGVSNVVGGENGSDPEKASHNAFLCAAWLISLLPPDQRVTCA